MFIFYMSGHFASSKRNLCGHLRLLLDLCDGGLMFKETGMFWHRWGCLIPVCSLCPPLSVWSMTVCSCVMAVTVCRRLAFKSLGMSLAKCWNTIQDKQFSSWSFDFLNSSNLRTSDFQAAANGDVPVTTKQHRVCSDLYCVSSFHSVSKAVTGYPECRLATIQ